MASVTPTGGAVLGVTITVSSIDVGSWITITRTDNSGHHPDTVVRGAYLVPLTPGRVMVFKDYEAPLNSTVKYEYRLYSDSGGTALVQYGNSSNFVTSSVSVGFTIFTDPLYPAIRASGTVTQLDDWSQEGRTLGEYRVVGRANPVVLQDVLGGRKGTIDTCNFQNFNIDYDGYGPYTQYTTHEGGWKEMFATGRTLYFRNTWSASGFDDMYFSVSGVDSARTSRALGSYTPALMNYSINFTEVDRPALTAGDATFNPLFTWQDLMDNYASWTALMAAKATWQDVMDNPIP